MLDMTKLTVSHVLSKIEDPDQYITLVMLHSEFDEETIGFQRRRTMKQPNSVEDQFGNYIVKNIRASGSRLILGVLKPGNDEPTYKSLNKSMEELLPPLDELVVKGNEMPYSKPKEVEVTCYANKNTKELLRT